MRKCAPLAVLAAAAFALAVPVAANAAVAGAIPASSTLSPDLLNATVTTVAANGTTVRYCFSKTIGSTPTASSFSVRTYRNSRNTAAGVSASATGQCADVRFPTVLDPTTFTTAGVAADAVVNAGTGTRSNADSTALIGSATNNGTRGRTTAPDLVGVTASGSTVSYTFDEALAVAPAGLGQFTIQSAGSETAPIAPSVTSSPTSVTGTLSTDRKTVTVTFLDPVAVAGAVRGTYTPGVDPAAQVRAQSTNDPAPISAAALPGSNGATIDPDPIQAVLQDGGTTSLTPGAGTIDVVFDEAVAPGAPGSYRVVLSDSSTLGVLTADTLNANTIRLTVATLPLVGEYVVGVQVAAVPAATAPGNTAATVPAGGNTGAFATGFTTGPDARVMTFDGPSNSATITFDQRYAAADSSKFFRVDNTGTVNVTSPATLSFSASTTPGPTTIVASFPSLAGTRALQILSGGVTTSLVPTATGFLSDPERNTNVDQVLAPIGSNAG